MRGLNVWGVEADMKQCLAAANRFDAFTTAENREEIEELIPPAVAYDFILVQSQLVLDITAAQRRLAKKFYDEARRTSLEDEEEPLPEASEVYVPPTSQAVMRSIYEFNYSDQLKDVVEQFLLPNLPRGPQYDSALPLRLRSTYKAPSSSSSNRSKSGRRRVIQKIAEQPRTQECITCGEKVTEATSVSCSGCGSSCHAEEQEGGACFLMLDDRAWCTKKCFEHFEGPIDEEAENDKA